MKIRSVALQCLLLAVMLSSGPDAIAEGVQGQSTAEFSEGLNSELTGGAVLLGRDLSSGHRTILAVYQYQDDNHFTVINVVFKGAQPGLGHVLLGEDADTKAAWMQTRDDQTLIGNVSSGSVEITQSADGRLSGSLQMTGDMMTAGDYGASREFKLKASFDAVPAQIDKLPGALGLSGS